LVLVERDAEVAGLEGLVAVLLAVARDLEHPRGVQGVLVGVLVLGEVLVLVAEGVGGLGLGLKSAVAGELTAVGDDGVLLGLVAALGGEVLDLADDGLAADDLAEDDVLAVKMGCGDSRDEELRAVGAWKGAKICQTIISSQAWQL